MKLHHFHGGVCPPEHKALSNAGPIRSAGIPPELVLPLAQHIGAPALPAVAVGERVLGGQCLTDQHGLPVHAPTSGTVTAIEPRVLPHPSGLSATCVVIACDGEDAWLPLAGCDNWRDEQPATLCELLFAAGIAGLGGAGFPTAKKIDSRRQIDTLIINGTECEPYITADDRLMRERAGQIISGVDILAHAAGVRDVLLGVEDNKPEAIAALREALGDRGDIALRVFPTRYPSGGEKQLIEILMGLQVPSGRLPADIGILVHNVGTAAAVHDAIVLGRPLVSRITTLTGRGLREPGNVEALLGTPMRYLLEGAGLTSQATPRLIMGGPMMGIALPGLDCPIIKGSNCLLVPGPGELEAPGPVQPCIRCGLCADACPARLLPQQLYWYARSENHEQLEKHNLFDCIECGACSWVCPSNIPLVQYYRASKSSIRSARAASEKSDRARERFEARQARIAEEEAQKAAKRAARKHAAMAKAAEKSPGGTTPEEDPIQAAIARAQAKRAQQAATAATDPRAAAEEKVNRIEARLSKAREKLAADSGDDATVSAALGKAVSTTEAKLAAARDELASAQAERDPA